MRKLSLLLLAFVAPFLLLASPAAFAHTTQDQAADTPLGGQSRGGAEITPAEAGFGGAQANGEAENALFRNPTCGQHNTHPPGNP